MRGLHARPTPPTGGPGHEEAVTEAGTVRWRRSQPGEPGASEVAAAALRAVSRPSTRHAGLPAVLAALRAALSAELVEVEQRPIDGPSRCIVLDTNGIHEHGGSLRPGPSATLSLDAREVGRITAVGPLPDPIVELTLRYVAEDLAHALVEEGGRVQRADDLTRLNAEARRLRHAIEAAPDGIAVLNEHGRVVTWNRAMADLTWVPEADALLQRWDDLLGLRDRDGQVVSPAALTGYLTAASGRVPPAREVLRLDRIGHAPLWIEAAFAPDRPGTDGGGVIVILRDVTVREDVERLKDDFLATVSHELRTPLTPLRGFLDLLARPEAREPEILDVARGAMTRQLDRLQRLVTDLLAVSDIDAVLAPDTPRRVDLDALVATVLATHDDDRARVRYRPRGISLWTFPSAAARIVDAVVDNALKHTEGGVTVRLDQQGDHAVVSVDDEGPGIPAHQLDDVLRPFGRLGGHLTRSQGPGLGLAIANRLAQRIGAEMRFDGRPGEGTSVSVSFPTRSPVGSGTNRREPDELPPTP